MSFSKTLGNFLIILVHPVCFLFSLLISCFETYFFRPSNKGIHSVTSTSTSNSISVEMGQKIKNSPR